MIEACAQKVREGDPDRFRATMAAPVAAREVLFPIYAFNLEVARAPWVSAEPMIAQMRLQWWRDALAEIAGGGAVRRHEVATPLAAILPADAVADLDRLVAARMRDTEAEPFPSVDALCGYLDDTGGGLMRAAAIALGGGEGARAPAGDTGWATGLAAWLCAVPQLVARARQPLPGGDPAVLGPLAREGLSRLDAARAGRGGIPGTARPAFYPGWRARAILDSAARDPDAILAGRLPPEGALASAGLLRMAMLFRW